MKTKIVEHIAGSALSALNEADVEVVNMRDRYKDVQEDTSSKGIGLDFAVLREKLRKARELIELLT